MFNFSELIKKSCNLPRGRKYTTNSMTENLGEAIVQTVCLLYHGKSKNGCMFYVD